MMGENNKKILVITLCVIFLLQFAKFAESKEDKNKSICNEDDKSCNNVKLILDWWDSISSQKPIKCKTIPVPEYAKKHKSKLKPVVTSGVCSKDKQDGIPFSFKGNISDDGQLQGVGKLTFLREKSKTQNESICVNFNPINGEKIKSIIGTFVNGTLHGHAKIEFDGINRYMIGYYQNGVLNGFTRFYENNKLLFVVYRYGSIEYDYCWGKRGQYLMYKDCSQFGKFDDQRALFITNTTSVFLGTDYLHSEWAESFLLNAKKVAVNNIDKTTHCMLNPKYDIEEGVKVPVIHYDIQKGDVILKEMSSKQNCTENSVDPDKALKSFWRSQHYLESPKRYYPLIWKFDNYMSSIEPKKDAKRFITDMRRVDSVGNMTSCYFRLFDGPLIKWKIDNGGFDENGLLHGVARLVAIFKDKSVEMKKVPTIPVLNVTVAIIHGEFHHGVLNGLVLMTGLNYGNRVMTTFVKQNVLHGPVIMEGVIPLLPAHWEPEIIDTSPLYITSEGGIGFIGFIESNKLTGPFWFQMFGSGFMHGFFDENGRPTGDTIAYIYPDMKTALVGRYDNLVMKQAQEAEVKSLKCYHGVPFLEYTKPSGPYFYFERPTNTSFGAGPEGVMDPFERKYLELKQSSLPNSGEGVFVKKDFAMGSLASYYSGFITYPDQMKDFVKRYQENTSMSDDYRRHCKKYSLSNRISKGQVNIPPEFDQPGMFHPTLGPKVNHDFRRNNSAYGSVEHARWGMISGVYMMKNIKAGEELFTNYGYGLGKFPDDFPWYWELKMKVEREERIAKEQRKRLRKEEKGDLKKKSKKKLKKAK